MLAGHCRHLNEKYSIHRLLNVKVICCSWTAIRFFLLVIRNITNAADKINPHLYDVKQKRKSKNNWHGETLESNLKLSRSIFFLPFSFIICEYVILFLGKESERFSHCLLHSLEFRVIFPSGLLPSKSCELSTPCYFHFGCWKERWIYTFFQGC